MIAFSKLTCSIGSLAINIGLTPSASPGSHMEAGRKVELVRKTEENFLGAGILAEYFPK